MGKEKEKIKRVVLDTNILISALIFRREVSRLAEFWKSGKIVPLISKATFKEFKDVLAYPKFSLLFTPHIVFLLCSAFDIVCCGCLGHLQPLLFCLRFMSTSILMY